MCYLLSELYSTILLNCIQLVVSSHRSERTKGTLTRNFKHLNLDFQLITDDETDKQKLKVDAWFGSRKTTVAIHTSLSHVSNLVTGVTQVYRYKMRFVYAHFPINASVSDQCQHY